MIASRTAGPALWGDDAPAPEDSWDREHLVPQSLQPSTGAFTVHNIYPGSWLLPTLRIKYNALC